MELLDAQNLVVQRLAALAPPGWERLVADVEIEEAPTGYRVDSVSFAIKRAGADYADEDIMLDAEARAAAIEVFKAQGAAGKGTLGGFALEIDQPGKYRFDFDWGKPKRLNGEWDAEKAARLDNYLQHYRAEKAAGNR